jgi:hypothetical protein
MSVANLLNALKVPVVPAQRGLAAPTLRWKVTEPDGTELLLHDRAAVQKVLAASGPVAVHFWSAGGWEPVSEV